MNFEAISRIDGSIGSEMKEVDLVAKLMRQARSTKSGKTPLDVVNENIDTSHLSDKVMKKYSEYLEKIATMDFPAAIKYTSNFYKKGLATYIPERTLA